MREHRHEYAQGRVRVGVVVRQHIPSMYEVQQKCDRR